MTAVERQERVRTAWARACDEVSAVYGDDGPSLDAVKAAAPGLATRIEDAEKRAEEKSVAWWAVARAGCRRRSMRGGTCGSKQSGW